MNEVGDDVDAAEWLLRRVPKIGGHYEPSCVIPITAFAMRPNDRDVDGVSLYRERELAPSQLANAATKPAYNYVVARLRAAEIMALGLSLRPTPDERLPGHVVIPELTIFALRDLATREWVKQMSLELAKLASGDIITDFSD